MAPTYEESQKQLKKATSALKKLAPLPKNIDLKAETEELTAFAKAYQQLDHAIATITVYTELD